MPQIPDQITVGSDTDATQLAEAHMMMSVRLIGAAMIGITVVVLVLNEFFAIEALETSGPFSAVIGSLETTGVAAISLLVVGLLVFAARRVMAFFGGGF